MRPQPLCVLCLLGLSSLLTLKADATDTTSPSLATPTPSQAAIQVLTQAPPISTSSKGPPSTTENSQRSTLKTTIGAQTLGVSPGNHPTSFSSSATTPSTAVPTTISKSTAAATGPSPSAIGGTSRASSTSTNPMESTTGEDLTTSAGSETSEKSTTQLSPTTATAVPTGPLTSNGSIQAHDTSRSTTKSTETETSNATSQVTGGNIPATPAGTTEATPSSPDANSTAPKVIQGPASTVVYPRVSSSPSTSQASSSSAGPSTYTYAVYKVTCSMLHLNNMTKNLLTLEKNTTPCKVQFDHEHSKLLAILCDTVKPGFKFTESKDTCEVHLGYSTGSPHILAVLGVSVQTKATAADIEKTLLSRTEDLKKVGAQLGGEQSEPYVDNVSIPVIITIVCLAAVLLLVAAIYSCCHQRQRHKKDQRLTEELQTMENGYHDNPTLEVMENSPEMQEKKPGLNGDLGDSWIVPIDNLGKEDLDEEEEDTHL